MSNKTANMDSHEQWDMEIKPRTSWFDLNLREIWRYKDLIVLLVKRDFIAAYKQTVLGPLWHFIQPILTSVIFLIVFSRIAHLPTDGMHPVLFYLSGITLWNYFSVCLTATSNTFVANAPIFGKVYFPRLIMPLSVIISNLVRFAIQFMLLFIVMLWLAFHGHPIQFSVNWFLIPFVLVVIAGLALGLGIIFSSLTTRYRDFSVLLTFAMQLLMYGTPIAYSLSYLNQQGYGWIVKLNPLTSLVEGFRYALFGKGSLIGNDLLYTIVFTVVVLFIGIVLFNKIEKTFIDTI
jgi:lipopolysaccharide transport system permease protein